MYIYAVKNERICNRKTFDIYDTGLRRDMHQVHKSGNDRSARQDCHSSWRENRICRAKSAGEEAETAAKKCSPQVVPAGLQSVRD